MNFTLAVYVVMCSHSGTQYKKCNRSEDSPSILSFNIYVDTVYENKVILD